MCPDSGGWTSPKPNAKRWQQLEDQGKPTVQLYDMTEDLGEQKNLAADIPERVKALKDLLENQVEDERTTPGAKQANDAKIKIEKKPVSGRKNAKKAGGKKTYGTVTKNYIHLEALLLKRGRWKIMMEYQKSKGTEEEWNELEQSN